MRLENTKPQTPGETEIRRRAHAKAILKGITMRQAVYEALEQWVNQQKNQVRISVNSQPLSAKADSPLALTFHGWAIRQEVPK